MARTVGIALRRALPFIVGLGLLAIAVFRQDPLLFPARTLLLPVIIWAGLAGSALLLLGGRRHRRPISLAALLILWLASPAVTLAQQQRFHRDKLSVLSAGGPDAQEVGRHFMVGFRDAHSLEPLARAGLIGGIFVTRRNLDAEGGNALRNEIAALQQIRRDAGLKELLVAADQEGGPVSRLSPPLPTLPPLSSLKGPADARSYGEAQGRDLLQLGVTVDFSPVVDLRPDQRNLLDLHQSLETRAISDRPERVVEIATAYARGLLASGVLPTLKHFPGLGGATTDTHFFAARLDDAPQALEQHAWVPFRQVLSSVPAALMIGHAKLSRIDPDTLASQSKAVVQGILRQQWGFKGLLFTDDYTMQPVIRAGLCASVVRALNAGIDVVLISYDDDQYYPAMACALDAYRTQTIDRAMLASTGVR